VSAASGTLRLHLERVLPAPPRDAFDACVEPDRLARWWGPAGFTAPSVDLDLRVGGSYRIEMQPPDAAAFHLRGEFLEIDPPRRLVYSFEWEEPDPDDRATVVELSFLDHSGGTRVVVDQASFATEARLSLHEAGWTDTLDRLEQHLARATPRDSLSPGAVPPDTA
jgi:uncharacterized protein YndB with AHSA1/START domain